MVRQQQIVLLDVFTLWNGEGEGRLLFVVRPSCRVLPAVALKRWAISACIISVRRGLLSRV